MIFILGLLGYGSGRLGLPEFLGFPTKNTARFILGWKYQEQGWEEGHRESPGIWPGHIPKNPCLVQPIPVAGKDGIKMLQLEQFCGIWWIF